MIHCEEVTLRKRVENLTCQKYLSNEPSFWHSPRNLRSWYGKKCKNIIDVNSKEDPMKVYAICYSLKPTVNQLSIRQALVLDLMGKWTKVDGVVISDNLKRKISAFYMEQGLALSEGMESVKLITPFFDSLTEQDESENHYVPKPSAITRDSSYLECNSIPL